MAKQNFIQKIMEKLPIGKQAKESGIGWIATGDSAFLTNQSTDSAGQNTPLQVQYTNAYHNFPVVAAAIDLTAEQVVQKFHFEGPNKNRLDEWAKEVSLGEKLLTTTKHMLINDGCWVEFPKRKEWKFVDPRTMTIHREITGDVIGHSQEINGKVVATWGKVPEKLPFATKPKRGKLEKIVYFPFNRLAGDKYGTSILDSVLPLLGVKQSTEGDLKEITRRYAAPIIHAQVGDETHVASDTEVESVKEQLEDIYADTEYVTSHLVKMSVLGFEGKGMNVDNILKHVDSNIIAGLQVPPELIGLGNSDKEASEVRLRSFGRHVKSIQRQLEIVFEKEVIQGVLGLGKKNQIVFGFAEEREEEIFFEKVRGLVTDGLITPQKANDLLPPKFHEKLPKPDTNAMVEQAARSQSQNQRPFQKGSDAVRDNPTDPTRTQVRSGQRRPKGDSRMTEAQIVAYDDGIPIYDSTSGSGRTLG